MATRRKFIGTAAAVGAVTMLGTTQASAEEAVVDAATDGAALTDADAARKREARDAILAVNVGMRSNYATLKTELIKKLTPVIIVQNDAKGGKYFLVHNGQTISEQPISETFELAKSIAHIPLGIFCIIAPYLNKRVPPEHLTAGDMFPHDLEMVAYVGPSTTNWIAPLQEFDRTITTARQKLEDARLPAQLQASCANILDKAHNFIENSVRDRSFTMQTFEAFSGAVYGDIRTNMKFASQVQIAGVKDIMTRWKAKVGDTAWKELYVVVLSIWTTSVLNQNSIILKQYMDQAHVESHLLDIVTAQLPTDPVFTALDNLARIVQDNIAAEMVFSADQQVANALKGKQDLLSEEILVQLGGKSTATPAAAAAAATCPITGKGQATTALV
ncbi:hypothetical protein [Streptomyces sp. NPDC000410]|uniref:hypothetical protein n=1 Tax=Streptomyces sp. NPDC000410 TaxID=3154254 RepID=UPI003333C48A